MDYRERQKKNLNSELAVCIEKVSEANHCKKLIASTRQERIRLEVKWEELKKILEKEEHDVERLSKISFSNFLHTILNNKDEKLDKEKQEALTAKLKCDGVFSQLEECKADLNNFTEKYNLLSNAEEEYSSLLKEKRDFIVSYMPDKWDEIEELIEEEKSISSQLKEIDEAISAGNNLVIYIDYALKSLSSAKNWGTWDMVGGGMLSTMVKRDRMSKAQGYINSMQRHMNIFARELKDIDNNIETDLKLDSFLGLADYFFDGFIVDWLVQSTINSAIKKVDGTYTEVRHVLERLGSEANNLNNRKNQINDEIAETIENA